MITLQHITPHFAWYETTKIPDSWPETVINLDS